MTRETYVFRNGNFILKAKDGELTQEYVNSRSGNSINPTFNIISDKLGDGVKGVMNPVNGKRYDSKSSYYGAVKDAGCHIIESQPKDFKRPEVRGDFNVRPQMREAVERVLNRGR